ncbi:MAG: patatin-like phospholipase family protein [Bacteroidota bacterium]|nr:patatin-like phospholipase family protein [Bacteroidota bacterium]
MKKKVALTLSSGGARGLAHIGVIEELEKRGYEITSVSGSSIGAVIGAAYASGKLNEFKKWICSLDKINIFKLMDFTVGNNGVIHGEKVLTEMKKHVPNKNIEDMDIHFAAVATDITNHKSLVFEKGDMYKAIRASIAIPTVLTPYFIDSIELVDGGVTNPLPFDLLERGNSNILMGVDLNCYIDYTQPKKFIKKKDSGNFNRVKEYIHNIRPDFIPSDKRSKTGIFNLFSESFNILQEKITALYIEKYKPDILIKISQHSADTFSFHRAEELIEYGREEAIKALDAFEKTISSSN